ncbi:Lrp/AsnC family transcriptional regulator [Actinotalea sp. BY-33]|uniref:Lrp/AsnC family transcriptional regulator n=1 Tax=Actinotalea soli TaxID=2819234 RepID=A0A939RWH3_9CELL|nr:Lrp/AsnC family transcriptional regulator [Actinotalea soli]
MDQDGAGLSDARGAGLDDARATGLEGLDSTARRVRTLDPLDAAILEHLAQDARASFAVVGARVNLSASAVKRRVDRLRADGVISGFTARVDPAALGWSTEAYVEVHCGGSTSPLTMREAFTRYPEIVAASTVTGEADAVVQIRARDVRHLDEVVERINAEPFVRRTRSTVVLTPLVRRAEESLSPRPTSATTRPAAGS